MRLLVEFFFLVFVVVANSGERAEAETEGGETSTQNGLPDFETTSTSADEELSTLTPILETDSTKEMEILQPRAEVCYTNCKKRKDSFGRTYRNSICSPPDKTKCTVSPIRQCILQKCSSCILLGDSCSMLGLPCCTPWYIIPGSSIPATAQCLGGKCATSCFPVDCTNNGIPCCETSSNKDIICRHVGKQIFSGKTEHKSLCRKDWCADKAELLNRTVQDLIENDIHTHPPACNVNGLGKHNKDATSRCDCPREPDPQNLQSTVAFECRKKRCVTCGVKNGACTKGGNECCLEFECIKRQCYKK